MYDEPSSQFFFTLETFPLDGVCKKNVSADVFFAKLTSKIDSPQHNRSLVNKSPSFAI